MNSFLLQFEEENVPQEETKWAVSEVLEFERERERELFLSRFLVVRTVGSRRSKKQSRSTR